MEEQEIKKESYLDGLKSLFRNKNYVLMMLISICNHIALNTSKTTLSLYGKSFGMTGAQLGALTGTYYLICTVIRPVSGPLVDRLNKKLLLSGCFVLKMVSWVIYAFCQNPAMFTVARYIDGVAFCLITTCFLATTSLLINKKAMGTGLAIYSGLPTLVTVFLPVLATFLYDHMGGRFIYWVGLASMGVGILLIQCLDFSKQEGKGRRGSSKFSLNDFIYLPAVPVCMLTFFINLLMTVNDTYLLVMAEERGIENAAIFFSLMTGLKLVSTIIFGAIGDAFGVKLPLAIACIATAATCFLLGSCTGLAPIIVAGCLYSFAKNGAQPVLQKAATDVAPREKRGAAISTNYFIFDIAGVLAGYICALLFEEFGYTGTYYVCAAFPVIGLIWLFITYERSFGKMKEAE